MSETALLHDVKYFESHITIEPVFGERLERFKVIAAEYGFKAADLLMQKQRADTPTRSDKDTFCTGRGQNKKALELYMSALVKRLQGEGFQVWRYKIEAVLIDERINPV